MPVVTYYGTKPLAYCQIKHLKDLDMVTRDQNPELNLRTFSNVGPSWPDVHKVRLKQRNKIYDREKNVIYFFNIKLLSLTLI